MIEYTTGQPVEVGDVVHVRNRAYAVARLSDDYVMLQSMDERKEFKAVYPSAIGAHCTTKINAHVHPTFQGILSCLP